MAAGPEGFGTFPSPLLLALPSIFTPCLPVLAWSPNVFSLSSSFLSYHYTYHPLSLKPPSARLASGYGQHPARRKARMAAVYNEREMSMVMLGLLGPEVDLTPTLLKGSHLIHIAAETGDLSFLQASVERGLDFDLHNERGRTPLHYAVMCSRVPVVRFLLAQYRARGRMSRTCCGSRRGHGIWTRRGIRIRRCFASSCLFAAALTFRMRTDGRW